MILNTGPRWIVLARKPCILTAVRHKGIAEWRNRPDRITQRVAVSLNRYEHWPRFFRVVQILDAIRVGSLSLVADARHVFAAWRTGRIQRPLSNDLSRAPRVDLLAMRRLHITLRQCGVLQTFIMIPFFGYIPAFLAMRHPTKYMTPYFWSAAEEHEVISNSFYSRESFFQQVADELLASKLTDATEKLAIEKAASGDFSSLKNLVAVFARKFPLQSLSPQHMISLARCWNLWKVAADKRYLMPDAFNRFQLRRYLRLVQENDLSISHLGPGTLDTDDRRYCWMMKGFPLGDPATWSDILRESAQLTAPTGELSAVAHINVLMSLGLAARIRNSNGNGNGNGSGNGLDYSS